MPLFLKMIKWIAWWRFCIIFRVKACFKIMYFANIEQFFLQKVKFIISISFYMSSNLYRFFCKNAFLWFLVSKESKDNWYRIKHVKKWILWGIGRTKKKLAFQARKRNNARRNKLPKKLWTELALCEVT